MELNLSFFHPFARIACLVSRVEFQINLHAITY